MYLHKKIVHIPDVFARIYYKQLCSALLKPRCMRFSKGTIMLEIYVFGLI